MSAIDETIQYLLQTVKELKESNEQNKTFDDHMIHMLIHGIYHILGFDHEDDKVAHIMETKEVTLLNKLNISDPYN